jgi:GT2 family glycosyltransferase
VSTIKAIITTLDNLPTLREQLDILRTDPLISEIVVVSNGSQDGTNEFL